MDARRGELWSRAVASFIRQGALALAVLLALSTVGDAQSEQGFTVMSVSAPPIITLDQDISQLNWQITASLGGGQTIVGSFSPDKSKSTTSSGLPVSSKFPLTISAVANPETITYPVIGGSTSLVGYEMACATSTDSQCVASVGWSQPLPNCPSGYGWRIVTGKTDGVGFSWWTVKCVRTKTIAARGSIDNPRIESSSSITLTANGLAVSQTLGRDPATGASAKSAEFGSGGKTYATVNCPGGLFTGNTWPNPSNFAALWWTDNSGWSVRTQDQLQSYLDSQNNFKAQLDSHNTIGIGSGDPTGKMWPGLDSDLTNLNGAAQTLQGQNAAIVSGQTGVATGTQNSGAFQYTGQALINAQVCTFLINAGWVGVLIEVGRPKITSFTIQSGDLGDDITGVVKVQNIGAAQGTFTASATCGPEVTQRFSAPSTTIGIGQSSDIALTLTTKAVGSGNCQVNVCDVSRPSICDISTATYSVAKPRLCSPNEKKVEGNVVKVCKEDGSGFDVLLSCSSDSFPQADSSGSFKCVSNAPSKAAPAQSEQTLSPSLSGELSGSGTQSDTQAAGASPIKTVGISLGGIAVAGALAMLLMRRRRAAMVTPQVASVDASPGQVVVTRKSHVGKWIAIGFVLLLVGGGLFLVATYQQPQVTIKSVSIKNLQSTQILTVGIPTGTTISVVAEVNNPNFVGGTVERVDYDILLNGIEAGHGNLPNQVAIPANGKADVPTEVSVSFVSGGQALLSTLQGGGLTAKVQGSVTIKPSILPFSVTAPFNVEKKVF